MILWVVPPGGAAPIAVPYESDVQPYALEVGGNTVYITNLVWNAQGEPTFETIAVTIPAEAP